MARDMGGVQAVYVLTIGKNGKPPLMGTLDPAARDNVGTVAEQTPTPQVARHPEKCPRYCRVNGGPTMPCRKLPPLPEGDGDIRDCTIAAPATSPQVGPPSHRSSAARRPSFASAGSACRVAA